MPVRPYRGTDEAVLVSRWAEILPYDALDVPSFRRRVLLDPNVGEDSLLVVEEGDTLIGFVLAVRRREPFGDVGLQPDQGWITAFGVGGEARRIGIATMLFDEAEERLAAAGVRQVAVAPYLPGYFVPGVDEVRYADALAFLKARGYEVTSRPLGMDACLTTFDFAPALTRIRGMAAEGIVFKPLNAAMLPSFLRFAKTELPFDWLRGARELLADGRLEQVYIAHIGERVIGYCQHDGEHFGPFGVLEDYRGKGVGTVLLARCLEGMRARGHHNAWVLWTSDETAARVYAKFGFRETRRFAVMRKKIR